MALEFDAPENQDQEGTFLTEPGKYHCLVHSVETDPLNKDGGQITNAAFRVHASVLEGTTAGQKDKEFNLMFFNPKMTDKDNGEMAKKKSPEDTELLKDLNETVAGMAEALRGITRFGKSGSSACEKILLSDFMRHLLAIAAVSPQARGIKFRTLYPENLTVSVNASRSDLQQACFNLIKNAVEAVGGRPAGEIIEIAISSEGKDVKILISDSGPGIPEDVLKTLFRKSITTKKDGTGVGLLITRDLLMRNYGEVTLRNREGGGLAATVSLPAA